MKRPLIIISSLCFCGMSMYAQVNQFPEFDKDSLTIYFKNGRSNLELSFIDNAGRISAAKHKISKICEQNKKDKFNYIIYSGASPEGGALQNDGLAVTRAEVLARELVDNTPLSRSDIQVMARGVDWESLITIVEKSSMPYKEDMLNVLRNTPEKVMYNGSVRYQRKEEMEALHSGIPFKWMLKNIFNRVRYASIVIEGNDKKVTPIYPSPNVKNKTKHREMPPLPDAGAPEKKSIWSNFRGALKTNVLYDAFTLLNIGGEVYLKDNWSLTGNWMYSWWKNHDKDRYWCVSGGDFGFRKWLGYQAEQQPLTGHHVGFFVQGITYDVEFGGKGYMSDGWNYGASFEYGFAIPISKRVNFDFSIGLGYFGGKNIKYEPGMIDGEKHYIYKETNHFNWVGPTKLEASLVILLGKCNDKK